MSVEKLVEHFSALEDPRCFGKVEHRLIVIPFPTRRAADLCAESTLRSMAATSWAGFSDAGQRHSLARHLPAGLHADRCLRGLLHRLGSVLCPWATHEMGWRDFDGLTGVSVLRLTTKGEWHVGRETG